MSGDARPVLVHWALPLLARARRAADECAAGQALSIPRDTWELLAGDIADLIGHSVTDQPPADELDAILASEPALSPQVMGRRGTREYFAAAAPSCPACNPAAAGLVPVGTEPCATTMVHYFGPRDSSPVAGMFDLAGHPPGCPAWSGPRCPECRAPERWIHEPTCAQFMHGRTRVNAKSGEPATPVEETPEARARRLDRERDDAAATYRQAVQAADAAWRAIGGRP